jgi:hypothetical protein
LAVDNMHDTYAADKYKAHAGTNGDPMLGPKGQAGYQHCLTPAKLVKGSMDAMLTKYKPTAEY